MKLHPWDECIKRAEELRRAGADIYQQWNCAHCGVKQTMPEPNHFYQLGHCEECKLYTDIKKNGMNYMVVRSFGGPKLGRLDQ